MRAVTFQAPGEVRVDEVPDPELTGPDEAIVRVEASGVCGSDLHIYHGRVAIEEGFILGHEYVGTVDRGRRRGHARRARATASSAPTAPPAASASSVAAATSTSATTAASSATARRSASLQGAQAELLLVPNADLTLRQVPDGMSDDVALFAGDVMGTGYHAVVECGVGRGLGRRGARARPGRPLRRAGGARRGRARRWSRSTPSPSGSRWRASFGAEPVHLTEGDPRAAVKALTEGRGVDATIDAVGHPDALELACRLTRKAGTVSATGVYAERIEVHMGIVWIKALTLKTGHANVIKHVDPVLERLASGALDPTPLVTHHMRLDDAAEAYEIYDRREALKIVLTP